MATSPASRPLHRKLGSGFLYQPHGASRAVAPAAAEARAVLTATRAPFRSAAGRVLPVLKPNQPKASSRVPSMYMGTLWAGIGLGVPSGLNLPMRGPTTMAPARALNPPTMWTTEEPAKSTWPWPSPKLAPSRDSQPPPQTQWPYTG